ncbi:MAG: hypothetical protein ACK5IJ_02985 [Mangrovibacterium sp.]
MEKRFSANIAAIRVRNLPRLSFGNVEYCRRLLFHALQEIDRSRKIVWLPEYEEVSNWMSDNGGKGLFLTGDCGRGKSNIIAFALPFLFAHYPCFERQVAGKILQPVHADDLHEELQKGMLKRAFYVVDEVGAEMLENVYGSKYYPFMRLMNKAEDELKLCFFSSNLTARQLEDKYDGRTLERVSRLCKVVKFSGASMRC